MGQCCNAGHVSTFEVTSNALTLQKAELVRRIQATIRAYLGRKAIRITHNKGGAGMAHRENIQPTLSSENEKVKVKSYSGN